MKRSLLLIAAVAAGTFGICDLCTPARVAEAATPATRQAMARDTVTLRIEGMTCGGCTLATRKVLERLDGVTKADVSYERKRAVVTYDPAKVSVAQMIAAVATLRYTATVASP